MSPAILAVVICTYDRADELDRALAALAAQRGATDVNWSVLVVDNAGSAATAAVVDRYISAATIPGLRRVVEPEKGLTPARRRGVLETDADWVAFVDDDNLLAPNWIAEMVSAPRTPKPALLGGAWCSTGMSSRCRTSPRSAGASPSRSMGLSLGLWTT